VANIKVFKAALNLLYLVLLSNTAVFVIAKYQVKYLPVV